MPIAGADRLRVGAEIAVKDLGALLSFLATKDDDLSLAEALRSPLFGLSEADLYSLAHGRGKKTLWQVLRTQKDRFPEACAIIDDLQNKVDYLRPYDLIERMLSRHNGRRKLLGRLGSEAEDGIDALLSQALAYERNTIPSLTGFLVWMETDSLEIKRQIDAASDQIRIMTVHGSKGLEAPIVILPECEKRQLQDNNKLTLIDDTIVWKQNKRQQPARLRAALEDSHRSAEAEALRLMYVALTRAEKWLIVTGSKAADATAWHTRIWQAASEGHEIETPTGTGRRLETGDWEAITPQDMPVVAEPDETLPAFFADPAKRPADRHASTTPSRLPGAKALPGEGLDDEEAKAYGTLVHTLLERLPDYDRVAGEAFFAETVRGGTLPLHLTQLAWREAQAVLADLEFAHVFAPGTLVEVPFTADLAGRRMHGIIDRLIVDPARALAIDIKTNRVVPRRPDQIPEGVMRQMAAYHDGLQRIFPDRQIETAILWTATPGLMRIPHDIVTSWTEDARYLDDPGDQT